MKKMKKIWEITAKEYIELNSSNGYISSANAMMAIRIERFKDLSPEKRKPYLIHGINQTPEKEII
jgi:hypothetical protein